MQGSEYGNIRQHPAKSNTVKPQFYPYSDPPALIPPSRKPVDVKSPNTVEKLSERTLKLTELKILVNKFCLPQDVSQMLAMATYLAFEGDDAMNMYLTSLHNIDRAKSGHN
jgi:hypothetical protein